MVYPHTSPTAAQILAEIKRAIRDGGYAWPGGYPQYVLMSDGEPLSVAAAKEQFRSICQSTINRTHDGWQAAGIDVNWEDQDMICAHTGEPIECAYPEE